MKFLSAFYTLISTVSLIMFANISHANSLSSEYTSKWWKGCRNNVRTQQRRKNRLTKLERIGELSTRDKNTVFNNIGYLICIDMLKEQYQQLDGNKAIGIDNVTKLMYGEKLDENLNNLIKRIWRGTYEPKPSRICEIPKEDGSTRPLAISTVTS